MNSLHYLFYEFTIYYALSTNSLYTNSLSTIHLPGVYSVLLKPSRRIKRLPETRRDEIVLEKQFQTTFWLIIKSLVEFLYLFLLVF